MKINSITEERHSTLHITLECEHCHQEDTLSRDSDELPGLERSLAAMSCESCGANSEGAIAELVCWSCKKPMTHEQRSENDGHCPFCNVEIDLDD
ncbi:MAG: hypothetical protein RSD49_01455 [Hafnia sp.]